MPRQRRDLELSGQKDKVFKQLKTEPSGILRERLQAVSLGLKGELSLGEIAKAAGRSQATIQTWFDLYRMGGIGASTSRVAFWMGKCGARLKVVRPRHPKSCERARFEFRNQMARKAFQDRKRPLKEGWKERPLRIWVADEARFGLQPCLRKAWVTRKVRAHKSSLCRCDWQYVWGALQISGGDSEFFYSNKADSDMSAHFLEQISKRDPAANHLVVWDGAGFHPENGDQRMPDTVVVMWPPPYSPELNPVEQLRDQLRDHLCNRQGKNLDHLLEKTTVWLQKFWETPPRIYSLVGSGWMLNRANT